MTAGPHPQRRAPFNDRVPTRRSRPHNWTGLSVRSLLASGLSAMFITAGCSILPGGSNDEAGPESSTTQTGGDSGGGAASDRNDTTADGDHSVVDAEPPQFVGLLAQLPAGLEPDGAGVELYFGDIRRAQEIAGIELPPIDDPTAFVDQFKYLLGTPPESGRAVMLPNRLFENQQLARVDEIDAELGWSVADVDYYIEQALATYSIGVYGGSFDDAKLTAAMGDPQEGLWRLGGEDLSINVADVSPARPTGEAVVTAVDGDQLIMSRAADPVRRTLDPDAKRLSDITEFVTVMQTLEDTGAYGGLLLANQLFMAGPDAFGQPEEAYLPAQFTILAAGMGPGNQASYVYWALDNDGANAIAAAIETFIAEGISPGTGHPWSSMFSSVKTHVDDQLVVATFDLVEGTSPNVLLRIIFARDGLAAHR